MELVAPRGVENKGAGRKEPTTGITAESMGKKEHTKKTNQG